MKRDDPYLDDFVKGWIVKTVYKHHWKVAAWQDFDDLVQEGYFCFAKCRSKFVPVDQTPEPTRDDRRRFMAFFQAAFNNRITDLANDRTNTPEVAYAALSEQQLTHVESWASSAAELGDGNVRALLAQAPAEILEMLKQILIDGLAEQPYKKSRMLKKSLPGCVMPRIVKGRKRVRETTNEHYDRCLGKVGVVETIRQYFLGSAEPVS